MDSEMWKDVAEYEWLYQISNLSRVRRMAGSAKCYENRILKQNVGSHGYLVVDLYKNNKRKTFTIHKLILEAFVGPCPSGMECRHLDGNPANNKIENLKWGTRSENVRDAMKHKTSKIPHNKGSDHGMAKLNEWKVRIIKRLLEDGCLTQKEVSEIFEVNEPAISKIQTHRTWKHIKQENGKIECLKKS